LWDHEVFGAEVKPVMKNQSQTNEIKMKNKDGFSANKKLTDGAVNDLLDETNRPIQKVLSCFIVSCSFET